MFDKTGGVHTPYKWPFRHNTSCSGIRPFPKYIKLVISYQRFTESIGLMSINVYFNLLSIVIKFSPYLLISGYEFLKKRCTESINVE